MLLLPLTAILYSCRNEPQITEWRGADRNGIYDETGLLDSWPEEGPEELWFLKGIGNGYGSPVIDGDRIYITGEIDSTAILHCITLDGKTFWQSEFGKEWHVNFPGSRSAPTIADDLIYVGSGMGNLFCMEKENGNIVWLKSLEEDFQGVLPRFGHSESAVVHGDMVFWTAGGKEHNVVALDRFTGDLLWSNPAHGERSGYHPPRLIEHAGMKILVTFSAYHLIGLNAETGELLWSHEQDNYPTEKRQPGYGDTHANTVLFEDGSIYYAEGDGNCGVKLSISEDGKSIEEIWRNKDFDSYMGGIVKLGGKLYGSGTVKPKLWSVDAESGVLTDSLEVGNGVVIAADEHLYFYNFKGEMKLISYDASGHMEGVSSFKITRGKKEHFSHPVISEGVLYLRHGNVLMAFDIKAKEEG